MSRISSADLVQVKGLGWSFQSASQARTSRSRTWTERCTPRLSFFLCESGEPPLDQVQPGRAGRCEVQVEARVCQQPLLDRRCLVRRVVVEDQLNLKADRDFPVELGQELLELDGPGWRRWSDPITLPVATSKAAKRVVVPARM